MKQAILITGYKNTSSFEDLINFFGQNFNFYLHMDKKSNVNLSPLRNYPNVFISNKYVVNWGGINHLKAILLLANTALQNPENSFFHLITAEDFPLKTVDDFAKLDTSKNYLNYWELPAPNWKGNGGMDRIDYYHFYDLFNAKKPGAKKLLKRILSIQKKVKIKRGYPKDFLNIKLYGGSTYWSLNRAALQYVTHFTDANKWFLRRFNHTFCSEEFYFQTIILNSSHAGSVVNDHLRYIDWESGRGGFPAFLDKSDFTKILLSSHLFARKINDARSNELKLLLTKHLQKRA